MYTVGLYTLGCKVSQYETEAVAEEFERRGFEVLDFSEICDAYVINTCTVTAESDRKSRQFIRRALKRNPGAVVAVMGCYSQRDPSGVAEIDGVSVVVGTDGKLSVVQTVVELLAEGERKLRIDVGDLTNAEFEPMCITRAPRTRAYVKIEDGCESKCTYCAISPARGRVRSKRPEDVISEVEGLYRQGSREIVLTGIETGSYGRDFREKYTLGDLIAELDKRGSCERVRLGSLAPELVGEEFVSKVRGLRILAPHFHMSMQSGSDKVLAAMKRRYNTEMAERNIASLRAAFPDAAFTTDMMVGFPGESDEDFIQTVNFVRRVGFLDVHVFAYSRREGTPAADYPNQIDESVKKRRSRMLIDVKNEVRDRILSSLVTSGKVLSCILESEEHGVYSAHSDSFVEVSVNAPSGMQGESVLIRPVLSKDGIIYGEIIK